jgi:hypothetical protein
MKSTWPPIRSCIAGARRAATIRHELEFGAERILQIDAAHVRAAAGAHGGGGDLAGIGLEPGYELLEVARRQVLARHDPLRRVGHEHDRHEIAEQVELQRDHRSGTDMARPVAETQRVAVRRGARSACGADRAACATDILDNEGLAERGLHVLGQDPRQRRGGATGRERHDQGDRSRRIVLRGSRRERSQQAGQHRSRYQLRHFALP